ncbi:TniQ family protein [Piscinibacterium candidicorallinum]|uniref:TniQ family protein n=1 Tax=Piscinibacterium candidicorallinum TaxID=1793872 RepID=A0ABV7H9P8_9BURK
MTTEPNELELLEAPALRRHESRTSSGSTLRRLVRVPAPFVDEAPASWLLRLAASQGVRVSGILRLLKIPSQQDPDLAFMSADWERIKHFTGYGPEHFQTALTILNLVRGIGSTTRRGTVPGFLSTSNGEPSYSVCACCLKQDPVPYFRLHWRVPGFSICSIHRRKLRSCCKSCGRSIKLEAPPAALADPSIATRSILQCSHCDAFRTDTADSDGLVMTERAISLRAHELAYVHGQVSPPVEAMPNQGTGAHQRHQTERCGMDPHVRQRSTNELADGQSESEQTDALVEQFAATLRERFRPENALPASVLVDARSALKSTVTRGRWRT